MSGQFLELIIFAGIAFFIINKFISILGNTSADDPTKNKSFFGESSISNSIKDVTSTRTKNPLESNFLDPSNLDINDLILLENKGNIEKGLHEVLEKVPSFDIKSFISGARTAFYMIVRATLHDDSTKLKELVDKRYIGTLKSLSMNHYGTIKKDEKLLVQISEIYLFGNNVFIKVLLVGAHVNEKIKDLNEEWTFSKNALSMEPSWYLSNIDRTQ